MYNATHISFSGPQIIRLQPTPTQLLGIPDVHATTVHTASCCTQLVRLNRHRADCLFVGLTLTQRCDVRKHEQLKDAIANHNLRYAVCNIKTAHKRVKNHLHVSALCCKSLSTQEDLDTCTCHSLVSTEV